MTDTVTDLRVDYERAPTNVAGRPRFSWRVDGGAREQAAYRVRVARSEAALREGRGEVWDSGRVADSRSTDVPYEGPPLDPDARYAWTVRVRDGNGGVAEAEPATFGTALGGEGAWAGEWIGHQPDPGDSNGFRTPFVRDGAAGGEWVQVDLGDTRLVEAVELHPARPFDGPETPDGTVVSSVHGADDGGRGGPAGFGFPAGYRVEVAGESGFEDPTVVADRADADEPGTEPVALDAGVEGRYVRVTATDPARIDPAAGQEKTGIAREERAAWRTFALAALAVRGPDGTDLARGRPVAASASVEAGAWGREHLVDGVYESTPAASSPLLRTDLHLSDPVAAARVHVCGLGYGELRVNGERVGDAVLDPAWTQYDQRAPYRTYEVGEHLSAGENALGLWLGRGWFGKNARDWTGFGSPRARLHLTVEHPDGTTTTVGTDTSWRAAPSPIEENDVYDGERYDARRERDGWAEPGFDDADWASAAAMDAPGGDLEPQRTPPIRETETFEPEAIEDADGGPIVDFGQNLVGWVALTVRGADAGDEITIRHAETRLEDGSLNEVDLRSADAADTYVARGDGVERYRPRFTYHGFRYAQVEGFPGDLDAGDIEARAVHTDMEPVGSFDCADDDLAGVQHNAEWGLRGNVHGVLTDCPQRDERFGWTGDNHIAARALMYNFDAARFYEKWQADHDDAQSRHGYVADTVPYGYGTVPEDRTWGITRVTVPWHLYRHYGDRGVLERHYEAMRRYVDYWHSVAEGGVIGEAYGNYGDWLAFENADGRRGLPYDLYNTAFHYHTADLFARIAGVLGNDADATAYAERAEGIAEGFEDAFLDPAEPAYGPGTQSSYAVPLFVGLVPEEREAEMAAALAAKVRSDGSTLRTGFLGTRPLLDALVEYGYPDLAFEVVSQPERPGWVYMVRQGATTMWERWDSDDRVGDGMNSYNHSPFTFVSEWFFSRLAGLDFAPSIAEGIEIAPAVVDDLDWAAATLDTVDGPAVARWEHDGEGLRLEATVPWNTPATVRIPAPDGAALVANGQPVVAGADPAALPEGIRSVERADGAFLVGTRAGDYTFERSPRS
ncbi:MAG: family 78 glycoside hydrolase catalytic domain [Halobacteriales archaeon]